MVLEYSLLLVCCSLVLLSNYLLIYLGLHPYTWVALNHGHRVFHLIVLAFFVLFCLGAFLFWGFCLVGWFLPWTTIKREIT